MVRTRRQQSERTTCRVVVTILRDKVMKRTLDLLRCEDVESLFGGLEVGKDLETCSKAHTGGTNNIFPKVCSHGKVAEREKSKTYG
jgi:hypothetical protein